jgi:alkylated DNA repair dioxygenase AlkB
MGCSQGAAGPDRALRDAPGRERRWAQGCAPWRGGARSWATVRRRVPVLQPASDRSTAAPSDPSETIQGPQLRLRLWRGWLATEACLELGQQLLASIPWDQPQVMVYGRLHRVPRLVAWYGDPGCTYRYSGLLHQPRPWTPALAALRQRLRQRVGLDFNSLLLNRYRDGSDRMGWHADDEPELEPDHPIASLSLGASRTLRFRPKPRRQGQLAALAAPFGLELADGDLLLMDAPTQEHWQHGLPARLRLRQERLNLTFRRIRRP